MNEKVGHCYSCPSASIKVCSDRTQILEAQQTKLKMDEQTQLEAVQTEVKTCLLMMKVKFWVNF